VFAVASTSGHGHSFCKFLIVACRPLVFGWCCCAAPRPPFSPALVAGAQLSPPRKRVSTPSTPLPSIPQLTFPYPHPTHSLPPLSSSSTPTPPSPHLHHSEFPTALPRSRTGNCLVAPTLWFLLSPSTTPGCNIFTIAHPQLPTAATTTGCCRCSLPPPFCYLPIPSTSYCYSLSSSILYTLTFFPL